MATEKQKMLAGEPYVAMDEELAADARRAAEWMEKYNASIARTRQDYRTLLCGMLAGVDEGSHIRPPFHCDYGYNIGLGDRGRHADRPGRHHPAGRHHRRRHHRGSRRRRDPRCPAGGYGRREPC